MGLRLRSMVRPSTHFDPIRFMPRSHTSSRRYMVDSAMKTLYLGSVLVAVCAAVRSPPPGAIVVAKSGGDFDSVSQ